VTYWRLGKQRLIAPDIAPFEQRGTNRQVAAAHPHQIVERAARLPDLEPQIPQEIEHRLDHLFAPGGLLAGRDKGDIDIRMRGHFAPAITADRHDRQPLAGRPVARRVDLADHVIVDHPDQLVDQKGLGLGAEVPGTGPFEQAPGDFRAAIAQRNAQQFDHFGPGFGRAIGGCRGGDLLCQCAAIDHRALIGDPRSGQAVDFCSASHSGR
jgi:hypothetical protein